MTTRNDNNPQEIQEPDIFRLSWQNAVQNPPLTMLECVLTGLERPPSPPPPPPPPPPQESRKTVQRRPTLNQWHCLLKVLFTLLTDAEARNLFQWAAFFMLPDAYKSALEFARAHGFFTKSGHWKPRVIALCGVYNRLPEHLKFEMFTQGLNAMDANRRNTMCHEKNKIMGSFGGE